jgi:hypothetical protein
MRNLTFLATFIAFAAPTATDPLAQSAQRKLDIIQSGKAKPGAVFVFSVAELNSWARYKLPGIVPEGVRNPRLELGNGTATGYALVNLLKVRHGQGLETNWFISKLIDGEKPVKVNVRIDSAHGKATVYLKRVEISGLAISGSTLDFLIDNFFKPLYPDSKIDEPFELADNVDHIEVHPADARAVMKR